MNCDKFHILVKDYPQIEDNYKQVISPQTAYQITTLLEGVVKRGTGKKIKRFKIKSWLEKQEQLIRTLMHGLLVIPQIML